MNQTQEDIPAIKEPPSTHWPSVLQFGFSSLAILMAWGVAGMLFRKGVIASNVPSLFPNNITATFIQSAIGFFIGVLILPSAGYSLARITGRKIELGETWKALQRIFHPKRLILLFPVIFIIGIKANNQAPPSWLILAPTHLLAVSIPVLWLVWISIRRIHSHFPQRSWGIFSSGLVLGPVIIFALEIAALIVVAFFAILFLAFNSDFLPNLELLTQQFKNIVPNSQDEIEIASQLLNNPVLIFSGLMFISVLVPLIEEAVKPIGVWLLAGRNLTPKEGFTAGIISGAGYALFENLFNIPIGPLWSGLIVTRLGTTILHIFNTGIIGYTLALAWREKRYLRLGAAYLLAVILHGFWNGLAIIIVMVGLNLGDTFSPSFWLPAGAIFMIGLPIGLFTALILINRKLRREGAGSQDIELITDPNQRKEQTT